MAQNDFVVVLATMTWISLHVIDNAEEEKDGRRRVNLWKS
jgi:hypothetical protein